MHDPGQRTRGTPNTSKSMECSTTSSRSLRTQVSQHDRQKQQYARTSNSIPWRISTNDRTPHTPTHLGHHTIQAQRASSPEDSATGYPASSRDTVLRTLTRTFRWGLSIESESRAGYWHECRERGGTKSCVDVSLQGPSTREQGETCGIKMEANDLGESRVKGPKAGERGGLSYSR